MEQLPELTIEDFKQDINVLLDQNDKKGDIIRLAEKVISHFYIHIRAECIEWCWKEHNVRLFK